METNSNVRDTVMRIEARLDASRAAAKVLGIDIPSVEEIRKGYLAILTKQELPDSPEFWCTYLEGFVDGMVAVNLMHEQANKIDKQGFQRYRYVASPQQRRLGNLWGLLH